MVFYRITFLLTFVLLSGCSLDPQDDSKLKPKSKTVSVSNLKPGNETAHPLKIGNIAEKQNFDPDKDEQRRKYKSIGTPYLGPSLHPELTENIGFSLGGSNAKPDLLRSVIQADVRIASPGKITNIFHQMQDSDDNTILHKDIENDFVVLGLDKTNLKSGMHMDLYSEVGHHSIGAVSINALNMPEQKLELRNELRAGVMTVLGNCTIYPKQSDRKGDTIYAKAFYLGENASLMGSNKEGKVASLEDIKAFRAHDRHKLMKLESLSYHYPDDPLAQAVTNSALKYLDFYGVGQYLINDQDTFWINGKIIGVVNLRGGAHLFSTNYMYVDLSFGDDLKTINYNVFSAEDPEKKKTDFSYVDDVIVEDGMVHFTHTAPMLGRKLFLKDESKFYLRTSTQFVHRVSEDASVYDKMKTDFIKVLKDHKPKSVEMTKYNDKKGEEHEIAHLNLGHRYAMYMEHLVLHGKHHNMFRFDDKGSQVDFFGNRDGKWDLGNGSFYIPLIFIEDNSMTHTLDHHKDHEDKILVLGVDDKASEISHAKLRLYHESLGHDLVILMQVKGEKDLSSGLALNMAQTLQGSMPATKFYTLVESVDPVRLEGAAQTEISNMQDIGNIAQYDFARDLIAGNKLKLNCVKVGQLRHSMLSAQKASHRMGVLYAYSPKATYAGLILGKSFEDQACIVKFSGACSNATSCKAKLSKSQFNMEASYVKKVTVGGGVSVFPSMTFGAEYSRNGAFGTNIPLGGRPVSFLVPERQSTVLNADASCGVATFDQQIKLIAGVRASVQGSKTYDCVLEGKAITLKKTHNDLKPYVSCDFSMDGVIANLTISPDQATLGVGASL